MRRALRLSSIPPDIVGQIAGVKAHALAAGRDMIDLASDDLALPLFPPTRDQFCRFLGDVPNVDSARAEFHEAVARWFEGRFGIPLASESEITEVPGSKAGYAHALGVTVDPGDVVLVPALAAPWVNANILLADGVPYEMTLRAENGWLPDLTALPGDVVQRAKLLFLNYPHNPTGAVATPELFQDAVNFARETGVQILHDATYAPLGYGGHRASSILEAEGAQDVALEMHSLSYLFHMGGWDVGFMVGSAEAIRGIQAIQSTVHGDASAALDRTAAWAFGNADPHELLAMMTRRRDVLVDGLNGLGWNILKPKAGPFVWLPVPPGQTSASFAQTLLAQAGVLTLPGLAFGPQGDGHVRLSLAASEERLAEAVRRMGQTV